MNKDRKNIQIYLLDISYKYPMNKFEEHYGDGISYSFVEQESYIDLKRMVATLINQDVKFRKFDRNKTTLTIKVEMLDEEFEKLNYLIENGDIKFLHDFEIRNIRKYNTDELWNKN